MSRYWILSLAALELTATPVRAQTPAVTYSVAQRPALLRDSIASTRDRIRRLLGLAPAATRSFDVAVDTVHATRCPMPVVVPDTSRITVLPVDRRDSVRVLPMPTARRTCINSLFRPR